MFGRLFGENSWFSKKTSNNSCSQKQFSISSLYEVDSPSGWTCLFDGQFDSPLSYRWYEALSDAYFASMLFDLPHLPKLQKIPVQTGKPKDHLTKTRIDGHGLIAKASRYPINIEMADRHCWCHVSDLLGRDYETIFQYYHHDQLIRCSLRRHLGTKFLNDLSRLKKLPEPENTRAIFALKYE